MAGKNYTEQELAELQRCGAAQVLGTIAYNEGRSRAPALDPDMMQMVADGDNVVGSSIWILAAFLRGWDLANLAANDWDGEAALDALQEAA